MGKELKKDWTQGPGWAEPPQLPAQLSTAVVFGGTGWAQTGPGQGLQDSVPCQDTLPSSAPGLPIPSDASRGQQTMQSCHDIFNDESFS